MQGKKKTFVFAFLSEFTIFYILRESNGVGNMESANVTVSVPRKTKERMGEFMEINWSGFVRKCIEDKVRELSWRQQTLAKLDTDGEFEEWAVKMGRKVNADLARRLKAEGLA